VSPVSSTERTTIIMPAMKPKMDQEIRFPDSFTVVRFPKIAPSKSATAPASATSESGNFVVLGEIS
jgi:hypothetical protein